MPSRVSFIATLQLGHCGTALVGRCPRRDRVTYFSNRSRESGGCMRMALRRLGVVAQVPHPSQRLTATVSEKISRMDAAQRGQSPTFAPWSALPHAQQTTADSPFSSLHLGQAPMPEGTLAPGFGPTG